MGNKVKPGEDVKDPGREDGRETESVVALSAAASVASVDSADVLMEMEQGKSENLDNDEGSPPIKILILQRMKAMHDLEEEIKAMLHTKVPAKNMGAATGTIEDNGEIAIENPEQGTSLESPLIAANITTNTNDSTENNDGTQNKEQGDPGNKEDDAREKIPPDAFSMLFVAKTYPEYVAPFAVFGLQILILVLISIDLRETYDREVITFMNIPVGVPLSVTVSQVIACIVSVTFSADDLATAVLHVGKRIDPGNDSSVNERARRIKWEVSNLMRMVEGILVIGVSFILIIQSSTAINLWLNFAGVTFVGQLDNILFDLSEMNFLRNKELAKRVSDCRTVHDNCWQTFKRIVRIILSVVITVAMFGVLSIILYKQIDLQFACKSITITVEETTFLNARQLSGTYTILEKRRFNGRAVYVQKQGIGGGLLAYCDAEKINRWTVVSSIDDRTNFYDPCDNINVQSERTRTYDVTEIRTLTLWTGAASNAEIKCNDCNPTQSNDCSWHHGDCNAITKSCECYEDYFGQRCQFQGPCTEMVMQNAFHGFGGGKSFDLASFDRRPVMVNDRPVYFQKPSDGNLVLILFDGGRWLVIPKDEFWEWKEGSSHDGAIAENDEEGKSFFEYLENDFNSNQFSYAAHYVSEYSSHGSPMGVSFRAWLTDGGESYIGRLGDEEFDLLCADCKTSNHTSGIGFVHCNDRNGTIDWPDWPDLGMCIPTQSILHGEVNRCNCTTGFDGPDCNIRPVEGTVTIHLEVNRCNCTTGFDGPDCNIRPVEGTTTPLVSAQSVVKGIHGLLMNWMGTPKLVYPLQIYLLLMTWMGTL
uniref:EGF-like domain-containing protein n=2 Tax=Chaetoceros debilis TaxID=122233 RepID=A0A6S8Z0G3_9STRA